MVLVDVREMSSASGAPSNTATSLQGHCGGKPPSASPGVSWGHPHRQLRGQTIPTAALQSEDGDVLSLCAVFPKEPEACPSTKDQLVLEGPAMCAWAFGPISFIQQNSPESTSNVMGSSKVLA